MSQNSEEEVEEYEEADENEKQENEENEEFEEESEEETPLKSQTESDYHPDSAFFESNGFVLYQDEIEQAQEARDAKFLNKHLTVVETETYMAIKYGDVMKLKDLGA